MGNPPPPRPINTQLNLSTKYDQNINRKFKTIYWDINLIGHMVKSSKARRTFQRIWSVKFISQWTFFHGYNLYLCLRKANFSDFKSTCIKLYQELINHQTISLSRDHCKVKKWYLDRLKIFTEINIFAFIWFIYMCKCKYGIEYTCIFENLIFKPTGMNWKLMCLKISFQIVY